MATLSTKQADSVGNECTEPKSTPSTTEDVDVKNDARILFNPLSDNWTRFTTFVYIVSLIPHVVAGVVILQTLILVSPPHHR